MLQPASACCNARLPDTTRKTNTMAKRSPHAIRCLVADLSGTIIDHGSCAPAGVFVSLLARHAIQITFAQARGPMGLHKREHLAALLELPDVKDAWKDIHGKKPAESDIDALYAEFVPLHLETLPEYGDLIPGVVETAQQLRKRGIKIATSTGYDRQMMKVVLRDAKKGGFAPDAAFCTQDVPFGRPAPWMIYRAMETFNIYPARYVVKVGDTIPDIDAGLNAGCWTVGVTRTGNMLGLRESEVDKLDSEDLLERLDAATTAFEGEGAHYVVETFSELPEVIDDIETKLAEGGRP